MNLDDLLKSIREEDDSKGGKINAASFKSKTFKNPLVGQKFKAPGLPTERPVVIKVEPSKLIPKDEDTSKEIIEKLDELIQVIKDDNKLEKDQQDYEKRQEAREKRQKREKRIEAGKLFGVVGKTVDKAKKKIGDIFNTLLRFAGFTLLGTVIKLVTDFLSNPENEDTINNVINFIRSIPKRFEELKEKIIPVIEWFKETGEKIKNFAEDFRQLLTRFPFLGQYFKTDAEKAATPPPEERLFTNPLTGAGQVPSFSLSGGGMLSMGTDTVPAMLTPGEFVMSRGAVDMFGVDTMMAMNKAGGGTNRPKYGMVPGFQGGGAVAKVPQKGADFWTLVAVAGTEDNDPQACADVAQSIYNRSASGVYSSRNIISLILANGQYEPTWKHPRKKVDKTPNPEWYNITDIQSAAVATGKSISYLQRVADVLQNSRYQEEARRFVGGRTDFMGGKEKPKFELGDVRRGKQGEDNFFGFFVGPGSESYGATNPDPGQIPSFVGTNKAQAVSPAPTAMPSVTHPPVIPSYSTGAMMGPAFGNDRDAAINRVRLMRRRKRELESHRRTNMIYRNLRNMLTPFIGPPDTQSNTKFIVLPDITKKAEVSSPTTQIADDIPEFSISSGIKMRGLVGKALGIEDLVS